ncbi:type IV toxin-antitoxin system AbiEi family antitoxin domain-containing protein [Acidobacteriota bacterium]
MKKAAQYRLDNAKKIFRQHGGVLRMSKAIDSGINRHTLYSMLDAGIVERLSRGLYRLADLPPLGNPDLTTVALKIPDGVFCLISALAFHQITTQIPHEIYVALARDSRPPRLEYPPIRTFWFAQKAFSVGIETHEVDGVSLRVYSPEKTVADCFKYRNRIGIDVALEALKLYRERKQLDVTQVIYFARVCRVEKVMRPYLEALL